MARIPQGASLILNKISAAPGFNLGNVFVMAGIPTVMQAMLDEVLPTLCTGKKLESVTLDTGLREGDLGTPYGEIQKRHPDVMMGSYPFFNEKGFFTRLVLRARDARKTFRGAARGRGDGGAVTRREKNRRVKFSRRSCIQFSITIGN